MPEVPAKSIVAPAHRWGGYRRLRVVTLLASIWGVWGTGCKDLDQPYKMVDELLIDPKPYADREMKVHGWVEPGSIEEKIVDQEMHRSFVLQRSGKKLKVTNIGPAPDTFRDQSEVVAAGKLTMKNGELVFEAKELQAKCPSKYEGAQQNKSALTEPKFK